MTSTSLYRASVILYYALGHIIADRHNSDVCLIISFYGFRLLYSRLEIIYVRNCSLTFILPSDRYRLSMVIDTKSDRVIYTHKHITRTKRLPINCLQALSPKTEIITFRYHSNIPFQYSLTSQKHMFSIVLPFVNH